MHANSRGERPRFPRPPPGPPSIGISLAPSCDRILQPVTIPRTWKDRFVRLGYSPGVPDEPQLSPDLDPASRRYGELVIKLGRQWEFRRGWQTRVANELGVSRSYVSKIVSGAPFQVGEQAFERAVDRGLLAERDEDLLHQPHLAAQRVLAPQWAEVIERAERVVHASATSDEEALPPLAVELAEALLGLPLMTTASHVKAAYALDDHDTVRRLGQMLALQVHTYRQALRVLESLSQQTVDKPR